MQDYLVKNGTWNGVKKRAQEVAGRSMTTPIMAWFKMKISCPVLDPVNKLCQGYQIRPAICSTHFVTSPVELCDPWATSPGQYQLADMDDLLALFLKNLEREIDGYGILALRLPTPVALIFAEKIKNQSGLTSDEAIRLIFTEYA